MPKHTGSAPADAGLRKAFEAMGGVAPLAEALGLQRTGLYRWTSVPYQHILTVEKLTNVPREVLRPDLFLASRPKKRA